MVLMNDILNEYLHSLYKDKEVDINNVEQRIKTAFGSNNKAFTQIYYPETVEELIPETARGRGFARPYPQLRLDFAIAQVIYYLINKKSIDTENLSAYFSSPLFAALFYIKLLSSTEDSVSELNLMLADALNDWLLFVVGKGESSYSGVLRAADSTE